MLHSSGVVVDQILIPFLLWVYIVFGATGVALGLGLVFGSARTLPLLRSLNRWTSLRSQLKPMEVPRDIDRAVYRHRRWFGAVFAIGGAFVVAMLLTRVDFASLATALGGDTRPGLVALIVESLRWFLIIGGVLAIIIGAMLLLSTDLVPALSNRVNRWYSPRKLGKGGDRMYFTLDEWTEAYPRTAGTLLTFGSLIVLTAALIVWLRN